MTGGQVNDLTRRDPRNHAGTPVAAGVPATRNPIRTLMDTEEVPVTSIAPRLVAATHLTMPGAGHVVAAAAKPAAADTAGLVLLAVLVVAGILLAAAISAARGLAAALAELARFAAVMMSAVVLTTVVILMVLALLIYH
jgi:hypothetical protein